MKKRSNLTFLLPLLLLFACKSQQLPLETDQLVLRQVSAHVYQHISYLHTEQWGNVACNGAVFVSEGEAVIFDTPLSDSTSTALIELVQQQLNAQVVAVVVNHHHNDCLGGLPAFHKLGIPSYSSAIAAQLAATAGEPTPQNTFSKQQELQVGGKKVINSYFGPAHAEGNIVSYIPSEQVLFGGCMIKVDGGRQRQPGRCRCSTMAAHGAEGKGSSPAPPPRHSRAWSYWRPRTARLYH